MNSWNISFILVSIFFIIIICYFAFYERNLKRKSCNPENKNKNQNNKLDDNQFIPIYY